MWGCFGLTAAADCDVPHVLAEAWFCQLQVFSMTVWHLGFWEPFRGYINARAPRSEVSCWSFREVGFGLLVVVLKEETKGKKLDSEISISFFPVCPSSSLSNGKRWNWKQGIKGGRKTQSKDQLHTHTHTHESINVNIFLKEGRKNRKKGGEKGRDRGHSKWYEKALSVCS